MALQKYKTKASSPVFEQANLDRLKKCSASVTEAEALVRRAQEQIKRTEEVISKAADLRRRNRPKT